MNVSEALAGAMRALDARGVPSPRNDAELLLAKALALSRTQLYSEHDRSLTVAERTAFDELVARRVRREPLAYVLGEWGFRRLTLAIDARVLVPRPETEVVVERCLERIRQLANPRVLDVGTGSGAIALALADEAGALVTGIDSSPGALEVARANLEATGLRDRVELLEHDLTDGLALGDFDLVVSNPPYVDIGEIEELEAEVREWEPREALVGHGVDELVAAAAPEALYRGGWLVLETAAGNADPLARKLKQLGYTEVETTRDLAGIDRVAEGRWIP